MVEQAEVPLVVDAGLGAPSHAAGAMELGADAVLVNTAIAVARDPVEMARAFRLGVDAGRRAFLAGGPAEREVAEASSPLTGFLESDHSSARPAVPAP
jgi:thiazole synthase